MWECVCDCGNECVVSGSYLRQGENQIVRMPAKRERIIALTKEPHGDEVWEAYGDRGVPAGSESILDKIYGYVNASVDRHVLYLRKA